jgi:hypothetical protein
VKRTFAEQVPELTFRYGRSTLQLRRLREHIALALAGRAGARLTEAMAVGLGKDAIFRLIRGCRPLGFVVTEGQASVIAHAQLEASPAATTSSSTRYQAGIHLISTIIWLRTL